MSEENPPSRVLRQRLEREYALPLARAMFELEPRCQSVLVTVGQYWCDEATDAVHCGTIACAERDPVWPAAGQARLGALGDETALAEQLKADAESGAETAGLEEVQYGLFREASQRAFGKEYFGVLDVNSDMIVAFASYCREVSSQEEPSWRSHTPYGLIRRPLANEPPTFEVIGQMYRPEWEDRWDVLDNDGIISGWNADPEHPTNADSPILAEAAAARRAAREAALAAASQGAAWRPFPFPKGIFLFALTLVALIVLTRWLKP